MASGRCRHAAPLGHGHPRPHRPPVAAMGLAPEDPCRRTTRPSARSSRTASAMAQRPAPVRVAGHHQAHRRNHPNTRLATGIARAPVAHSPAQYHGPLATARLAHHLARPAATIPPRTTRGAASRPMEHRPAMASHGPNPPQPQRPRAASPIATTGSKRQPPTTTPALASAQRRCHPAMAPHRRPDAATRPTSTATQPTCQHPHPPDGARAPDTGVGHHPLARRCVYLAGPHPALGFELAQRPTQQPTRPPRAAHTGGPEWRTAVRRPLEPALAHPSQHWPCPQPRHGPSRTATATPQRRLDPDQRRRPTHPTTAGGPKRSLAAAGAATHPTASASALAQPKRRARASPLEQHPDGTFQQPTRLELG